VQPPMIDLVVLIKRQSPDWQSLAADYRRGRPIAPERYVPPHPIPGFPPAIETLIDTWNKRFAIDFFTVRAIIAGLSQVCISSVARSHAFGLADFASVERLAGSRNFMAFFHDDDDFFAPDIFARLLPTDVFAFDTCVFPLYRIHADLFTFVRDDMQADFVLGRRQGFDFRFQSNNYGVSSRLCSAANLRALTDHVLASRVADACGFSEKVFSSAVSATVKTPASASQLPVVLGDTAAGEAQFSGFFAQFSRPELPADHAWLAGPLSLIARLLQAVAAGEGYEAIGDLIDR
jgi:hypothetical protein